MFTGFQRTRCLLLHSDGSSFVFAMTGGSASCDCMHALCRASTAMGGRASNFFGNIQYGSGNSIKVGEASTHTSCCGQIMNEQVSNPSLSAPCSVRTDNFDANCAPEVVHSPGVWLRSTPRLWAQMPIEDSAGSRGLAGVAGSPESMAAAEFEGVHNIPVNIVGLGWLMLHRCFTSASNNAALRRRGSAEAISEDWHEDEGTAKAFANISIKTSCLYLCGCRFNIHF